MIANCEVRATKPLIKDRGLQKKKPGGRIRSCLLSWLNYDMKSLIIIISRVWLCNNGYASNIENEINFIKNRR